MSHYRFFIGIFISLLLCSNRPLLWGQQMIANVQKIGIEDGLSSYNISQLFQDSKGFIWIATNYGLNRYDGTEMRNYTVEEHGLCHNNILEITEDANGNIWILAGEPGGAIHFCILDPIQNTCQSLESYLGKPLPFDPALTTLFAGKSDAVLLAEGTASLHVRIYEYDGKDIKFVFGVENTKDSKFQRLVKSGPQHYTASFVDAGLSTINENFYVAEFDANGKYLHQYNCVSREGLESIADENYIFCETYLDNDLSDIQFHVGNKISKNLIENTPNYFAYKKGKIYSISSSNIKIYALDGSLLQDIPVDLNLFSRIRRWVSVLIDRDENIWVYNYSHLYRISLQQQYFQVELANMFVSNRIRGMTQNKEKDYYVAAVDFFATKSAQTGVWSEIKDKAVNRYLGVLPDDGHIWVGGEESGLLKYDIKTKAHNYYSFEEDLENKSMVWMPYKAPDGTIWAGCSQGLFKVSESQQNIIQFKGYGKIGAALRTSAIYAFHKNNKGTWLSTSSGLYLLDLEKEQVLEHYSSEQQAAYYIPSNHIAHLHEDKEGVFWLATKGNGLIKWNPNTKEYKHFTKKNAGLSHNVLYAVYEDDFGNLWLSSDKGLMRFDKESGMINIYLQEDGLPHNEFNTIAHFKAEDGQLFFGGQNGLVRFYPKNFQEKNINSSLVLTSLYKQKKEDEKLTNFTSSLLTNHTIQLTPDDKFFTLKFALLDYRNPKTNQYSYQIVGYHKNWIYQSETQIQQLNDLPYGNYILKLRAKSPNSKNWIDYPTTIRLQVLRPFYLQWWFILSAIIAFIGVLYVIFKWRIRRLTERQKELENIVAERTAKIEQDKKLIEEQAADLKVLDELKSRFFANISHELRTPLTLVLGPLSYMLSHSDSLSAVELHKQLTVMERNGKNLLQLIEEILDLAKLDARKLVLNEEATPVGLFFNKIFTAFESQFQQLNINATLHIDSSISDTYLLLDRNKIEKVFNNFLGNAIKFTPKNGQIDVKIIDNNSTIKLIVTDTGKGIHPKDLPFIFERFYQSKQTNAGLYGGTGIGLALVREFAGLMQAKTYVESELGKGSSFYFELPKKLTTPTVALEILENIQEENSEEPIEIIGTDFTILVVEDNNDMRHFICTLLEKRYKVLSAINGLEGLELLNANPNKIHLIVSDIMMPEVDGLTMLKQLKTTDQWRGVPIIMLTALAAERDKLNALMLGVDDYLVKPFSVAELMARIQNLLFNYHQRRFWQDIPINDITSDIQTEPIEENDNISESDLEWLNTINTYIKDNIDADFDNNSVATHFHLSQRQFERRLKKITGLSPAKFIKEIRLQMARKNLEDGNFVSITEIAYTYGFQSIQAFSRAFTERFGKKPSEYI